VDPALLDQEAGSPRVPVVGFQQALVVDFPLDRVAVSLLAPAVGVQQAPAADSLRVLEAAFPPVPVVGFPPALAADYPQAQAVGSLQVLAIIGDAYPQNSWGSQGAGLAM